MANDCLSEEYDAERKLLQNASLEGAAGGILGLKKVLGPAGPDRTYAAALDQFRDVALKFKEADRIMESAGLDPAGKGVPAEDGVKKVAALKFLRHLYLVGQRGSQQVWVLSTPKAYAHYPQDELLSVKTNHAQIKSKLADTTEVFDDETRKRFCEATQLGLAWCEAAKTVLSTA